MGVFSKLKNIFYDEEVIEEPEAELKKVDREIKSEVEKPKIEEIKVIKPEPVEDIKEEIPEKKLEDTFSDRDLFRNERKFNFTELDDEEEVFPSRRNVLNTENKSKPDTTFDAPSVQLEQPRVFKPSPIISPIYGILDKDYKKEEVVSKQPEPVKEIETPARDYDSVRRKAYGTLEDELEDTLNSMNKITPETISKEVKKIDDDIETLEEKPTKIEDIINEIESTTNSDVSVGELEDKLEIEHFDDEDEEEKVDKTMTDSTLEHDLFNLIDSMYDDKEE
ncbi:MAG: hypothetical protein IJK67_03335 [Bacilli bacterium]|nr:hypothetical protein [Bacilli bacterium]